jgi:hypothetical protein
MLGTIAMIGTSWYYDWAVKEGLADQTKTDIYNHVWSIGQSLGSLLWLMLILRVAIFIFDITRNFITILFVVSVVASFDLQLNDFIDAVSFGSFDTYSFKFIAAVIIIFIMTGRLVFYKKF